MVLHRKLQEHAFVSALRTYLRRKGGGGLVSTLKNLHKPEYEFET